MNEREQNKMKNGEVFRSNKLSKEQEAWLDEKLASDVQAQVSQMVRALPECEQEWEPELAWRSELSAKLHAVAAQKERKRRLDWFLRPTMGLGLAAAMALVFLYRPGAVHVDHVSGPGLEAQIISAHKESVEMQQFWGSVRADDEAQAMPVSNSYKWEESDLGTL